MCGPLAVDRPCVDVPVRDRQIEIESAGDIKGDNLMSNVVFVLGLTTAALRCFVLPCHYAGWWCSWHTLTLAVGWPKAMTAFLPLFFSRQGDHTK
jgi:hypothetical protein